MTDTPSASEREGISDLARPRESLFKLIRKQPNIIAGLGILGLIAVIYVAGTTAGLEDPLSLDATSRFLAPSQGHLFGTDQYGRDLFSRVIWGTRLSIGFGLATLAFGSLLGLVLGAMAGYLGGVADTLLTRIIDTLMAFPLILVAIVILSTLGIRTSNVILSIGLVLSPRFARVIRSQVLQAKVFGYVEAARAVGASRLRIFLRHILPNCSGPWIVMATLTLPYAILVESSLSFLGLGVQPDTPTWGRIIADGRSFVQEAPWICIIPGIAITLCSIGFNLLGDGLRDLIDPRTRR